MLALVARMVLLAQETGPGVPMRMSAELRRLVVSLPLAVQQRTRRLLLGIPELQVATLVLVERIPRKVGLLRLRALPVLVDMAVAQARAIPDTGGGHGSHGGEIREILILFRIAESFFLFVPNAC